jgi:hypothetical protein
MFSPLESYLVMDLSLISIWGYEIVGVSSVLFCCFLWLPYKGINADWDSARYSKSDPVELLESEFDAENEAGYEEAFQTTAVVEDNALWTFEYLIPCIGSISILNICGMLPWGSAQTTLVTLLLTLT